MSKKQIIHVGDVVRFPMVGRPVTALVIEDFGNIGLGGTQLVRVRYSLEDPVVMEMEMPVDRLELVEKKKRSKVRK